MAKNNPPITTAAQVARRRVIVRSAGEVFTLPVNPRFAEPNQIDERRGVDFIPGSTPEIALAEAGMAIAVQNQIFKGLSLRSWLGRQFRRRGGASRFVDELLGLEPPPAGADAHKFRAALLRSVERAGPAKKGEGSRKQSHGSIRNIAYQRRIAHYVVATHRPELTLGVTGLWEEDLAPPAKPVETYRGFRTDPDDEEEVTMALDALMRPDGAGFIEAVVYAANNRDYAYAVRLLALHGLHVELVERV